MTVTLYSNHCPRCNVLTTKLNSSGVSYDEENDIDVMIAKGFSTMPMLEVDGKVMGFAEAVKWVNEVKAD